MGRVVVITGEGKLGQLGLLGLLGLLGRLGLLGLLGGLDVKSKAGPDCLSEPA